MGFETFEAHGAGRAAAGYDDPDPEIYVKELSRETSTVLIGNVRSEMHLVRAGNRLLPVSVNHGDMGGSYVSLPHSAYALYAREELDLVDLGWMDRPARLVISLADKLLRAIQVNHVVQIDNWLLSTNLHGDWRGEEIDRLRENLVARYPDHYLAIRSVDPWTCPELLTALEKDDWLLIPSRQIWVTDDMERDWYRRNNVKNDRRALRRSGLTVSDVAQLTREEAERIVALYRMLYLEKYSCLNPDYGARWLQLAVESRLLKLRLARDAEGIIMAAAGFVVRDGIATNPMLGYDTSRSQSEGLYRIACYLFGDYARTHGLRVNGSAGAAHFKQLRGARSEVEYTAFHVRHLSLRRQRAMQVAAKLMNMIVVPVMKNRML